MKPLQVTEINFGKARRRALKEPGVVELRKRLRSGHLFVMLDESGKFDGFAIRIKDGSFTGDIIDGIYTFDKWLAHPAHWYQFWYPQTGVAGGIVLLIWLVITTLIMMFINGYLIK